MFSETFFKIPTKPNQQTKNTAQNTQQKQQQQQQKPKQTNKQMNKKAPPTHTHLKINRKRKQKQQNHPKTNWYRMSMKDLLLLLILLLFLLFLLLVVVALLLLLLLQLKSTGDSNCRTAPTPLSPPQGICRLLSLDTRTYTILLRTDNCRHSYQNYTSHGATCSVSHRNLLRKFKKLLPIDGMLITGC